MATVRTQKVGPGELTLGEVGGPIDIACQITSATLTPDVNQDDDQRVLCGDVVPGARTYSWTLDLSLFQDWRAEGVNAFSIEHQGERVPFTYSPDDVAGVSVTGEVMIDPMSLGGEVDQRAESDWELTVVGDPVFTWETV